MFLRPTMAFDLTCPFFRECIAARVDVPNVRFESGFHPWAAAPDLSCYTFRHELLWKDQLYADISFAPLGEDARLIRAELHNNTDAPQNLVLHSMASAWDPVPSYRGFSLPAVRYPCLKTRPLSGQRIMTPWIFPSTVPMNV